MSGEEGRARESQRGAAMVSVSCGKATDPIAIDSVYLFLYKVGVFYGNLWVKGGYLMETFYLKAHPLIC